MQLSWHGVLSASCDFELMMLLHNAELSVLKVAGEVEHVCIV